MDYKIDDIDLEIVRHLWDGRTPYSDIAEKMGLATNTVRNRVNRMREEGALQIIGLLHPEAVEGHQAAFVGFKVSPHYAQETLQQIQGLTGVVGASAVSGRFDYMAIIMFNEEHSYKRFLEEELPRVDGLTGTETFFAVAGNAFQLRYVL